MKNECSIVRDLLALYAEDMVSDDTACFVGEHLENCEQCRQEFEQIKEPKPICDHSQAVPLKNLKKKIYAKKVWTAVFTALLITAVIVSAFTVLDAPKFFPYSEEIIKVKENSNNSITVTFSEQITDYRCEGYFEPSDDGETDRYCYNIEAWTSTWDRWFSNHGEQSTTIRPQEDVPFTVYYLSNNGMEDVCIYGEGSTDNGGMITLPRLVFNYYFVFAIVAFAALLAVWFFAKNKPNARLWIERIMLYPISYAIGHFIVLGFTFISYSPVRTFTLIVFISILLYCAFLVAHSLYRLRKEIKEIINL